MFWTLRPQTNDARRAASFGLLSEHFSNYLFGMDSDYESFQRRTEKCFNRSVDCLMGASDDGLSSRDSVLFLLEYWWWLAGRVVLRVVSWVILVSGPPHERFLEWSNTQQGSQQQQSVLTLQGIVTDNDSSLACTITIYTFLSHHHVVQRSVGTSKVPQDEKLLIRNKIQVWVRYGQYSKRRWK